MNLYDIPKPLTGDSLLKSVFGAKEGRKPIAEGFLYEQTINMIAAEPGAGKSTLAIQVAMELAAGLPVFGLYKPPRPMKVLYIQTERPILELLERIELISKVLPIVKENLLVTDSYQGFNLLNYDHAELFLECVHRDCPNMDVLFLDPIYCMVAGGLKEDVPASAFTKVMSRLHKQTMSMFWYSHHTVRPGYDNKGNKYVKDDPFYGSQWLKAHVTGYYHMVGSKSGSELILKKDNYSLMPDKMELEFDSETGYSSLHNDNLSALDKVRAYISAREVDQKEFYFKEIQSTIKLCTRTIRECLMHSSIKGRIFVVSSIRNKNLYKANKP